MTTPVVLASIASRLEPQALELLLDTPLWSEDGLSEREDMGQQQVLEQACRLGKTSLVTNLLELGVEPTDKCLLEAITYNRRDVVHLLLEDGRVDPSAEGNYTIKIASSRCDIETCRLLLEDERTDPSVIVLDDVCLAFRELVAEMRGETRGETTR